MYVWKDSGNFTVIYCNTISSVQYVHNIQHDAKNACFIGHTIDKRTYSHTLVLAENINGPYYEQHAWIDHTNKNKGA